MSSDGSPLALDLPHSKNATGKSRPENPQVIAALEEYLQLCEQGTIPDAASFVDRFPDIRDTLSGALAGLRFMQEAAPQVEASSEGLDRQFELNLSELKPLGDYRIIREIGRGGMGVVYEAEQMSLARRVALKILPFASVLDPRHLQRFKNEALAAAHLDHPNIVEVYGIGCERGIHFYAMRYIEGHPRLPHRHLFAWRYALRAPHPSPRLLRRRSAKATEANRYGRSTRATQNCEHDSR